MVQADPAPPVDRRLRSLAIVVIAIALFSAHLRVLDYGYMPYDDVLRHAATAVAEQPYNEVLLYDDAVSAEDSTPGWHAVLRALHEWAGLDRFALVSISIFGFFLLFTLTPLFFMRRPEAWGAALLMAFVVDPLYAVRLSLGRPFILYATAIMLFVLAWDDLESASRGRRGMLLCFVGATLTTWLHSTWFLLFAVPGAALATGRYRAVARMTAAIGAGVLVGACLTLQPWTHLSYNVVHVLETMRTTPGELRVFELQPSDGEFGFVVWALIALAARATLPELRRFSLAHAGVATAAVAWVLSLSATRFWADIGLPALMVTLALLLQEVLEARARSSARARVMLIVGLAAALHLGHAANLGGRWSQKPLAPYLAASEDPTFDSWLPGPGGVVYSYEMRVFYGMYFVWPDGDWKYVLGLEQGVMPAADRAVAHDFARTRSWEALTPWAERLRPEDRLVVVANGVPPPTFAGLEAIRLQDGVVVFRPSAAAPGTEAR